MFICEQWSTSEALRSKHAIIFTTRLHYNKIARIYTIKEKFCLFISAKFSCAIHQSKTFHPAFGDTKECHNVHMRMMFLRCGLGFPCVFSQPSHKLFSGLLIFPESVLANFALLERWRQHAFQNLRAVCNHCIWR